MPNALWKKSFTFASPSLPSSLDIHNTPRSPHYLLNSQRLPLNVRSEHPETIPSKTDPMGGKEDCTSSPTLNSTPTLSGSFTTRIPSNIQSSDIPLESHFPKINKNLPDEVFALPNCAVAAHSSCSSTSVHTGDTRGRGRLEDNMKVVRADVQVSEGLEGVPEGAEATRRSYAHPQPVQLTTTHRKLVTTPARMASSSTVSRLMSMAPHVPNSTVNPHLGPSIPLPRTHFSSKAQRTHHFVSPILSTPFHSLSATQKRSSNAQQRHIVSSPVSSATPSHFQQWPLFDVHPTYPHSDTLRPFKHEQRTTEGPLLSITVNSVGNTSSSMHDAHPIPPPFPSHNFYEHSSSHRLRPSTPFSARKRRSSSSPPFHRPNGFNGRHNMQSESLRIPPF